MYCNTLEINGLISLVLFEQREDNFVEQAKAELFILKSVGYESWLYGYEYLRVIRYQRELTKGFGCLDEEEVEMIVHLILNAKSSNDILKLMLLYRRNLMGVQKGIGKFIRPNENPRFQLFNGLVQTFHRKCHIALFDYIKAAIPIPRNADEVQVLLSVLLRDCNKLIIPHGHHIVSNNLNLMGEMGEILIKNNFHFIA